MEKIDYLPLGSIVYAKGGIKELMIVGRGLQIKINEEVSFFDYAAVNYPEGLISDQVAYFNHDKISKVLFKGFSDDRDQVVKENINTFLETNKVKRIELE